MRIWPAIVTVMVGVRYRCDIGVLLASSSPRRSDNRLTRTRAGRVKAATLSSGSGERRERRLDTAEHVRSLTGSERRSVVPPGMGGSRPPTGGGRLRVAARRLELFRAGRLRES